MEQEGQQMIKNYREKPVVVQAVQYTGNNIEEIRNFCTCDMGHNAKDGRYFVKTFFGNQDMNVGDYIIKDGIGYFRICEPDRFNRVYEIVE
jgi:hypothetical protein